MAAKKKGDGFISRSLQPRLEADPIRVAALTLMEARKKDSAEDRLGKRARDLQREGAALVAGEEGAEEEEEEEEEEEGEEEEEEVVVSKRGAGGPTEAVDQREATTLEAIAALAKARQTEGELRILRIQKAHEARIQQRHRVQVAKLDDGKEKLELEDFETVFVPTHCNNVCRNSFLLEASCVANRGRFPGFFEWTPGKGTSAGTDALNIFGHTRNYCQGLNVPLSVVPRGNLKNVLVCALSLHLPTNELPFPVGVCVGQMVDRDVGQGKILKDFEPCSNMRVAWKDKRFHSIIPGKLSSSPIKIPLFRNTANVNHELVVTHPWAHRNNLRDDITGPIAGKYFANKTHPIMDVIARYHAYRPEWRFPTESNDRPGTYLIGMTTYRQAIRETERIFAEHLPVMDVERMVIRFFPLTDTLQAQRDAAVEEVATYLVGGCVETVHVFRDQVSEKEEKAALSDTRSLGPSASTADTVSVYKSQLENPDDEKDPDDLDDVRSRVSSTVTKPSKFPVYT